MPEASVNENRHLRTDENDVRTPWQNLSLCEAIAKTCCPERSPESQLDVRTVLPNSAHARAALFRGEDVSHLGLNYR